MIEWRRSLFALLAIPASSWSGSRLTDSAHALGAELGSAAAMLAPPPPSRPAPVDPAVVPDAPDPALAPDGPFPEEEAALGADAKGGAADPRRNTKTQKRSARPTRDARNTRSLFVSEHTIVRLANARVVPTGQSVPASASRPAGIALSGVGALGIGLRDGDVLTEVSGRPAHAEGQVIAAILVSLTRHDRQISGVFYRGADRWLLVVELPIVRLPENVPVPGSADTAPATGAAHGNR